MRQLLLPKNYTIRVPNTLKVEICTSPLSEFPWYFPVLSANSQSTRWTYSWPDPRGSASDPSGSINKAHTSMPEKLLGLTPPDIAHKCHEHCHHSFPKGPVPPSTPSAQVQLKSHTPIELDLFLTVLYLFWRLTHSTVISWQNHAVLASKHLSHGCCFLRSLPLDVRVWPWPHLTPIDEPVPFLREL